MSISLFLGTECFSVHESQELNGSNCAPEAAGNLFLEGSIRAPAHPRFAFFFRRLRLLLADGGSVYLRLCFELELESELILSR